MQGYLYPENMNHVFDEEGYFKTGDIAVSMNMETL